MFLKKIHTFIFILATILVSSCSSDNEGSNSSQNSNGNPLVIQNAGNLEIPRIDDNAGKIISHYASGILNYTVDWHADKKHSRKLQTELEPE